MNSSKALTNVHPSRLLPRQGPFCRLVAEATLWAVVDATAVGKLPWLTSPVDSASPTLVCSCLALMKAASLWRPLASLELGLGAARQICGKYHCHHSQVHSTFSSANTMLETEHYLAAGGQLIPNSSVPPREGPRGSWILLQLWEEAAFW